MTEYPYDGATIEEIITSHATHDNYNSLRVWYRGEELNLKELKIVVYQEEEADWQIIKVKQDDGRTEYQVSDGNEYGRTYSYDFWTLHEAELCLNEVVTKAEHKEEV